MLDTSAHHFDKTASSKQKKPDQAENLAAHPTTGALSSPQDTAFTATFEQARTASLENPLGFALITIGCGLAITALGVSNGWLGLPHVIFIGGLAVSFLGFAVYHRPVMGGPDRTGPAQLSHRQTHTDTTVNDPRFERLAGHLEAELEALKDLQWEVRDSQARYRDLLDNQSDVILRRGHDQRLTFVNDAFGRTFEIPQSEVIGSRFAPKVLAGDKPPSFPESLGEHRRHYTQRIETKNGPRWFSWQDYAVINEHNKVTEIQSVGRDVTEQREAANELQAARDQAEAANKAKSQFLATMSHEIRTPMNGIKGMTDFLFDTDLSAEQKSYARTIETSARTLLTLIDEVLDFSKIEAGKLKLDANPLDLEETVQGVVELLAPRVNEKKLEIGYDLDPQLPKRILGDETRLRQILLNLAGNAIKFTEKGGLSISLSRLIKRGDEFLTIVVTDTGIGMAPEVHESIFAEFEQVDQGLSRRAEGTGLGLAIIQRLVQGMGGQIDLKSALDQGSTFTVCLPLKHLEEQGPSLGEGWPEISQKHRVLAACSGQIEARALIKILKSSNVDAKFCAPEDALQTLREADKTGTAFTTVMTDQIHSLGFIEAMSGCNKSATFKIIALISPGDRDGLPRLRSHGVNAYLVRPVRPVSLLTQINGKNKSSVKTGKSVSSPHKSNAACLARNGARNGAQDGAQNSQPKTLDQSPLWQMPPTTEGDANKLRVLLVEDNDVNMILARKSLEMSDCHVTHAKDGIHAVELVTEHLHNGADRPFDLIFMDIHMPRMDGFAATKAIREKLAKNGYRPSLVPIIALTANAFSESRAQCLAAGLDDYMPKPFEREALAEILTKWSL